METLVEMIFGSHMYGTATPESDTDYKGVCLPSARDCFLNRVPKSINTTTGDQTSKNTKNDTDREIYSLQYFIKLALEGQTVAIDMLHAPDHCILKTSGISLRFHTDKEKESYDKEITEVKMRYYHREILTRGIYASNQGKYIQTEASFNEWDSTETVRQYKEWLTRNGYK